MIFGSAIVAGAVAGAWAGFCALKLAQWHKARRAARARAPSAISNRFTAPFTTSAFSPAPRRVPGDGPRDLPDSPQ